LKFAEAIRDAHDELLSSNEGALILGQGVINGQRIFGSLSGLYEKYSGDRIVETPIIEETATGIALGASLAGCHVTLTHIRADFLLASFNQLINHYTKYSEMYGSLVKVGGLVRAIVGRSWGQGPQHSQFVFPAIAHFPGAKVIVPYDIVSAVAAIYLSAQTTSGLVTSFEHRFLYSLECETLPDDLKINPGSYLRSKVIRPGTDLTIVTCSMLVVDVLEASDWLQKNHGINPEVVVVVDMSDFSALITSSRKTNRVLVADPGWQTFGFASEASRHVAEQLERTTFKSIGSPAISCPTAHSLEKDFYVDAIDVYKSVEALLGLSSILDIPREDYLRARRDFKGPF